MLLPHPLDFYILILNFSTFISYKNINLHINCHHQSSSSGRMQRLVDSVIAITKESVKTFTYESLNHVVRLINGLSALLLVILPGKASILQGIHGWELRPTFRGPRLPNWMENGVSSFNQFIHEASIDSDTSSNADYSSEGGDDIDNTNPTSPLSQTSRETSFSNHDTSWIHWFTCILSWLLLPLKFILDAQLFIFALVSRTICKPFSISGPTHYSTAYSPRRLKDSVFERTTDRRRGIVEDLHLVTEIFIESVFDVVHKAAHCLLAPIDTIRSTSKWFTSRDNEYEVLSTEGPKAFEETAVLSNDDPTLTERKTSYSTLNTDARTCRDVITEYGYPYEAISVVTADGYVLLLERIPRRYARKVVYLQHGILDSSMGWISNGVVGSPAFAAFDQGYDVFLGNFRGLVSREHVDQNISSRLYWTYSINEHGTEDIPAMMEKIHEIKMSELNNIQCKPNEEINPSQPYKVCAICHSLGGAAILMYLLTRRIEEKSHRLSRMILLSPAGFHQDSSFLFSVVESLFLFFSPVLAIIFPAFYIPTRFFRMLMNKLARDFHNLPAVGGLVQTLMSYVVGGDSSNWVGVLGLPHYNMNDMPGVAFRVALHLAQMKHTKKFRMFDYGCTGTNMDIYGSVEPLDLGEYYGFIDVPVDLVAGKRDRVIRPSMVRKHYELMEEGGVDVSYREFEYAHLDFTFSHREELLSYVMSRMMLVEPMSKNSCRPKSQKLRRREIQIR